MPTAQLRKRGRIVELYFGHRYGAWTIYDDLDPAPSRDALIAELEGDPPASLGLKATETARLSCLLRP
jgi:hypothetical protein